MIKAIHVIFPKGNAKVYNTGLEESLIRVVKQMQKNLNQLSLGFAFNKSEEDGRQIILHWSSECASTKLRCVINFEDVHLYQAHEDGDNVVDTCFFSAQSLHSMSKELIGYELEEDPNRVSTTKRVSTKCLLKSKKID